jgi:DNA-binding response OmpR family regulator
MNRRILVVDDDEAIRTWLVRLLGGEGYTVLPVGTVDEGKRALATANPDLLTRWPRRARRAGRRS